MTCLSTNPFKPSPPLIWPIVNKPAMNNGMQTFPQELTAEKSWVLSLAKPNMLSMIPETYHSESWVPQRRVQFSEHCKPEYVNTTTSAQPPVSTTISIQVLYTTTMNQNEWKGKGKSRLSVLSKDFLTWWESCLFFLS